tara:strand:- start:1379 stop:1789 length:411 start_codon:yes stop_codon:yes gene_type:complete
MDGFLAKHAFEIGLHASVTIFEIALRFSFCVAVRVQQIGLVFVHGDVLHPWYDLIVGFFVTAARKHIPPTKVSSFFLAIWRTARNNHKITRIMGEESSHRSVRHTYKVGGGTPVPERVAVLKDVARKTAVACWAIW